MFLQEVKEKASISLPINKGLCCPLPMIANKTRQDHIGPLGIPACRLRMGDVTKSRLSAKTADPLFMLFVIMLEQLRVECRSHRGEIA